MPEWYRSNVVSILACPCPSIFISSAILSRFESLAHLLLYCISLWDFLTRWKAETLLLREHYPSRAVASAIEEDFAATIDAGFSCIGQYCGDSWRDAI